MNTGRTKKDARYEILFKLAAGGMATVYVGTARGSMGFRQLVAIKEPHAHLLADPAYRKELVAEARLASLIHHVNVVDVRDVFVAADKKLQLVMDYIEGASLGELLVFANKANERLPARVVLRIVLDACAGLHAAHELVDEKGRAVGLVHRDVSPQNLLIGVDGTTRVSDFGVAKATAMAATHSGALKGKLAYMSPEYMQGQPIDRRVDVFAIGVVAWEALCGKRLFRGANEVDTAQRILSRDAPRVSSEVANLAPLDDAIATALAKAPEHRFATAQAFASALESCAIPIASHGEVAEIVKRLAAAHLEERRAYVRDKLASEPGFLSLMGVDPPSIPSSARDTPRPSEGATTLVDVPPVQTPLTRAYGSQEPTTSDTLQPAGIPRTRPVIAAAAVALLALVAGATTVFFAARLKPQPDTRIEPSPSAPTLDAIAVPATSATSVALSASLTTPSASRSPQARPRASAPAHTTAPVSPPSSTESTGPPPNPY